jgi:hypothetical protein
MFQHSRQETVLWKCFLRVREWTVAIQSMRDDVTQQCVGITWNVLSVIRGDITQE